MIVDHIRNRHLYYGLGERFQKGLEYLAAYEVGATEFKDVEIDGENLFVRIRPITTGPIAEGRLEAHIDYADIHYVPLGAEVIGYTDVSKTTVEEAYDPNTDTMFLQGECDFITLEEGYFLIAGKDDAHMPSRTKGAPVPLEKVVMKIKLAE